MLERMVIADAEGSYDRPLDFTRPVTGVNFFAPAQDVLESLADPAPAAAPAAVEPSLPIGSLRPGR